MEDGPKLLEHGRFSYLFLEVDNLEEMTGFYKNELGFQLVYSEKDHCAFLQMGAAGGPSIALYKKDPQLFSQGRGWFFVVDVSNIEEAVKLARERRMRIGDIKRVPYGYAAFLQDPEGNVIEIHQPE